MSTASPILRNATALVVAQLVTKAVNVAVSVAMVRWLGALELGRYAYILAFCFPFGAVADFGLATLAIREISRDRSRAGVVLATLRRLLLGLTGISVAAMVILAALTRHDSETLLGIALVGLSSVLSAGTTPSLVALTAREAMDLVSLHRIAASVVGSLLTVAVLLMGGTVLPLLLAAAGTNLAMLGLGRWLAGDVGVPLRIPGSALRAMLRQAIPFGLLMVGFALYYRIDMVMLEWLRGPREVGLYAAAYRFLDAMVVLAASLGGPFFPRLSKLVKGHEPEARALLENAWRPLLALGLPLSLGTFLLADDLTRALFGADFALAGGLLRVLIWGTLPLFWINVANHALIAADRVWALAGVYGAGLLANVVGNLILIPRWGAWGASIATLACEWLTLALVVRLIQRRFTVSFSADGLWRYVPAAAGMALCMWLGRGFGLAAEIVLGALAYAGGLLLLGYLRSADMLAVRRLLAG
ncbi:MAG TPA: flippase [Methylomirabilota bacterium]|nr:flippase [Methylomirabilota bacterium]